MLIDLLCELGAVHPEAHPGFGFEQEAFEYGLYLTGDRVILTKYEEKRKCLVPAYRGGNGLPPFPYNGKVSYWRLEKRWEQTLAMYQTFANGGSLFATKLLGKQEEIKEVFQKEIPEEEDPKVLIFIDQELPFDQDPVAQAYWEEHLEELDKGNTVLGLRCPRTQVENKSKRRHKAVTVRWGHLISANHKSYESYGLENSTIFPLCGEEILKYQRGLLYLESQVRDLAVTLDGVDYFLLWEGDASPQEDSLLLDLNKMTFDYKVTVKEALRGQHIEVTQDGWLVGLAKREGRAIVSAFERVEQGQVWTHLENWTQDLRLEDWGSKTLHAQPLWVYALEVYGLGGKKTPQAEKFQVRLMKAALQGLPLPDKDLGEVVRPLEYLYKKEQENGKAIKKRLQLLKLMLNRRGIHMSENLDPSNTSAPYLLGQLLARANKIQFREYTKEGKAMPALNFVTRYYGMLQKQTPRALASLSEDLLSLVKGKPQESIEEILIGIDMSTLPTRMSTTDRAQFALGFWHKSKEKAFDQTAPNEPSE